MATVGLKGAVRTKARAPSISWDELRHVDVDGGATLALRLEGPRDPRLPGRLVPRVGPLLAAPRATPVVAGGHHRDPHLVLEAVVEHRAEDDVRLRVGGLLNGPCSLADLPERQVAPARDGEQDALRALERGLQQ